MGLIDSAKDFIFRRPTTQEQKVNTGGVMEPFAPLTSQSVQVPMEAPEPAPSPEPTSAPVVPNVGEPTLMPDATLSPDLSAPVPPAGPPTSEQEAA